MAFTDFLPAIIFLPFFSSLVIFLTGPRLQIFFITSFLFLLNFLTAGIGIEIFRFGKLRYSIGGWGIPLGIDLLLDGFGALMLILTALIGTCITVYSLGYLAKKKGEDRFFWPLWFFTWGGLNALFSSSDLINIYVSLEIIALSAIALITLAGSVEALLAAGQYLFLTPLGSLSYLLGAGFLYSNYSVMDVEALGVVIGLGTLSVSAIALMTIGLMIKGALFPMHFWLPSAHANAPSPVSAILSGLVITAPFYVLTRLWFSTFASIFMPAVGQILGILGTFAIFWGSLQALRQTRLKLLVAYSTVAQIGYLFLIFPLGSDHSAGQIFAWSGGIYFAVSHAFAKVAAFLSAGSIMNALGHDRIDDLSGLARRLPMDVFIFALAGINLMGMPPSGGFIAKWLLLKAAFLSGQWWYAIVILAGGLLSACYIFRVLEVALREPVSDSSPLLVSSRMRYSALAMAFFAVLLGFIATIPLKMLRDNIPPFFELPEEFFL